jgi:nucleotide-binding universal stress UspA family protein
MNILLPTDFSENSWNSISYASQLFKNETCTFYLLNTYRLTIYGAEFAVPNPSEIRLMETIKDASINGLEKISQRIEIALYNPKHTVSQISSFSTLTREMDEIHKEYGIDFIVMGTKGATGASKVLFGSNTVDVLNSVKCPVLAVPDNFDFEMPKEILFPSDYNIKFNESQLKPIIDLTNQSRVNILHVLYDKKLTDQQLDNRNKLEQIFKPISYLLHTEKKQNVPEAIEQYLLKLDINLLVMINNKHSFFENLFFKNKINEIGFNLSIPFLVIPSK